MTKSVHQPFNQLQGNKLLRLARVTLLENFDKQAAQQEKEELLNELKDDLFCRKHGTFVTLKIKDQLRGCIGNLSASDSVIDGIKKNAVNAAFHDHRFSPLSQAEFEKTDIEISILTEPEPLLYTDADDLLNKLKRYHDGVIIRKDYQGATFLPQVWEQLPDPVEFLSHLCRKAGLAPDSWRYEKLDISIYQVQKFAEVK